MKLLIKCVVICCSMMLMTSAYANNGNNKNNGQKNMIGGHQWNDHKSKGNNGSGWGSNNKHGGWHAGNGKKAHAVPELNAGTAPLAALLLSGLLAAGYERRRRLNAISLKDNTTG